jgi:hypothetical protein
LLVQVAQLEFASDEVRDVEVDAPSDVIALRIAIIVDRRRGQLIVLQVVSGG